MTAALTIAAFIAGAVLHAYADKISWWVGFFYHKMRGHHRER